MTALPRVHVLSLCCWFAIAAPGFGQFALEKDCPDEKSTDETREQREQRAWEKYVKSLGKGPVYQVEALQRGFRADRKHLYYYRILASETGPVPQMLGFGVDELDRFVRVPDQGTIQRVDAPEVEIELLNKPAVKPAPPLAFPANGFGFHFERDDLAKRHASMYRSCFGYSMPLPKKAGDATIAFIRYDLFFRVEMLTLEQAAKAQPLRQDVALYRKRTAELHAEVFKRWRDDLLANPAHLACASELFADGSLIGQVRKNLVAWLDDAENRTTVSAEETYPLTAPLARFGDASDYEIFLRLYRCLQKRAPHHAQRLHGPTAMLLGRARSKEALPLVREFLRQNGEVYYEGEERKLLRKHDPKTPRLTYADDFVITLVRTNELDPADFGLESSEARLLKALDPSNTPAHELNRYRENVRSESTHWTMTSEASRRHGYEQVVKWIEK